MGTRQQLGLVPCRRRGVLPRRAYAPWHQADIEHATARTEDWYAGDGWYTDGGTRNFDHYNGWAMHLYPLWYCRIAGPLANPGLAERYRLRLRRYLSDAAHLVGGDGAPLFQGRSLTYRFAALAPFWAGALFDAIAAGARADPADRQRDAAQLPVRGLPARGRHAFDRLARGVPAGPSDVLGTGLTVLGG